MSNTDVRRRRAAKKAAPRPAAAEPQSQSFLDRLIGGAKRIAEFGKSLLNGLKRAGAAVLDFVLGVGEKAAELWARLISMAGRAIAEVVRRVAWLLQLAALFVSLVLQTPSFIAIRIRSGNFDQLRAAWSCFFDIAKNPSATGYVPSLSVVISKPVQVEDDVLADFLAMHEQAAPAAA